MLNRVGTRVGDNIVLDCEAGHVGDDAQFYQTPSVIWVKDGLPFQASIVNTPGGSGRLLSRITFRMTEASGGIYQCVFSDSSAEGFEMFANAPTRLDIGEY